jgi:ribosome-associated toxin RatA of RatAB toxin-antitoxin module
MISHQYTSGGRSGVRRFSASAALALAIGMHATPLTAVDDQSSRDVVTVREERGVYFVEARFQVPQKSEVVQAVLTDYDHIPRFMPGVKRSAVLERTPGRALVEQEAVSRLMMFSKRVHIVLEIAEGPEVLTFRDRCTQSFSRYEGSWAWSDRDSATLITYQLVAKPSFDVPEFLLKRLLKRDAAETIEALRKEMAKRTTR